MEPHGTTRLGPAAAGAKLQRESVEPLKPRGQSGLVTCHAPAAMAEAEASVTHSSAALVDPIGLRVERRKQKASAGAPSAPSASALSADEACMRRRRSLELWLSAAGADASLQTVERVVCGGRVLAVDAAQEHLILEHLASPMGVYPCAQVRLSDMLRLELRGDWRLSHPLPPRPAWVDEEPPAPPNATAISASPPEAAPPATEAAPLEKYYVQRYMLFSRFDEGVALDAEGWYSVTPEVLAAHMAERCRCDLIIDAFCGVGGNAIQFAHTCERVVGVELDEKRLRLARRNAAVYGVDERIEWLHTDFFALSPSTIRADVVFLSPPWGGPEYTQAAAFDLVTMMGGLDGAAILRHALSLAPSVAYFLPRNADLEQVASLAREHGVPLEIERCALNGHEKGVMAYFGFQEEEDT